MEYSRDSSVWRSLAVAFGDGLAFGVGMKLTQPAGRKPSGIAAPADVAPLAQRLDRMEQRLVEVEQRKALPAPEKGVAQPVHPFDQKVLEAVINALDARLQENSGHVDRQLTELQAKITIELKTLHDQDRSIADGLQSHIAELEKHVANQITAIRQAANADRRAIEEQFARLTREVGALITREIEFRGTELHEQMAGQLQALRAAAEEDREASSRQNAELRERLAGELAALRHDAETARRAVHHEVTEAVSVQLQAMEARFRDEMRDAVQTAAGRAAASAAAQTEPLRAALEAKDREIAELRARLVGSDQATLELLQGVGEICRRAAARITAAQAPTEERSAAAAAAESVTAGTPVDETAPPPGRLWRVPLVSSLVLGSAGWMMHHIRL